jgi:hypothetical protein
MRFSPGRLTAPPLHYIEDNMAIKIWRGLRRYPLRLTVGLQLLLVGFFRSDIITLPFLRAYVEPAWLYGGLQALAGLVLLLTLAHRLTWYGRAATILTIAVASMLTWAIWQLGSTGAVIYGVMVGALLIFEVPADA